MDAPSMVQRSGDTLIVRRVVSGDQLYFDHEGNFSRDAASNRQEFKIPEATDLSKLHTNQQEKKQRFFDDSNEGEQLPQCKIKRNYSCNTCTYFTQNPRRYLTHLRDVHGEKIVINECKQCLYASRHYQKLVRHMKMVHGSTDGINVPINSRKRGAQVRKELKKIKKPCPPILDFNIVANMTNNFSPSFNTFLENNNIDINISTNNNININNNNNSNANNNNTNINNDSMSPTHQLNEMDIQKNKLLKCTVCEYTTPCREQLIEHEKGEHVKTKFFRCIKCSYVTHIKARFSKHVKYHSMPMIKCMMCDFRTPYKWNLDRHMKNHGGTGLFKCSICNFTADIKQSLTVHEMNHHTPPSGGNTSLNRRKNKVGGTDNMDDDDDDDGDDSFDAIGDDKQALLHFLGSYQMYGNMSDDQRESSAQVAESVPKKKRPIPNLIPIQPTGVMTSTPRKSPEPEVVCKIPGNASISDFTKLFYNTSLIIEDSKKGNDSCDQSSSAESSSSMSLKKKNSSFFDKLREKLITGVNKDDNNLECHCGYVAKSLSDSIIHQKHCEDEEKPINLSSTSSCSNSGSTRCKFCRHRCKSSADLSAHLLKCADAQQSSVEGDLVIDSDASDEGAQSEPHPMENIVFVWNKLLEQQQQQQIQKEKENDNENNSSQLSNDSDDDCGPNPEKKNETYCGVETAPGYGEVTQKIEPEEQKPGTLMKKVFKCPHCSFWASTASRFHVHIVGHLNKKPFECSLCSYRSNWRWDITKHIRLKTIRDPSHADAGVLMNDETGRRNYTKYNKYITLMKVTENSDAKNASKTSLEPCSRSEIVSPNHEPQNNQPNLNEEQQRKLLEYNAMLQQLCQYDSKVLLQQQLLQHQQQQQHQQQLNLDNNILQPLNLEQKQIMNNDTITQQLIDNANSKKIHFKCKKCSFKDSNREIVLDHVKTHYRMAGMMSDDSNSGRNSNDLPKDMTTEEIETFYGGRSVPSSVSITSTEASSFATTSTPTQLRAALNGTQGGATVKTGVLNGEMDEASSKGISAPAWRGTAPYRCGHCHQVSNWKHVIQRHCRLKHNGNILIELVNQNNGGSNVDGRHRKHHKKTVPEITIKQQTPPSSTEVKPPEVLNKIMFYSSPPQHHEPPQPILITPGVQITPIYDPQPIVMPTVVENMEIASDTTINPANLGYIKRNKRYQCMICPYVTDSKSQFLYHKSFHTPRGEPFKCNFCSYNVTKKHLLNQHMKMHAEGGGGGSGEIKANDIINIDDDEEEDVVMAEQPPGILDLTKPLAIIPTTVSEPMIVEIEERKIHYCSLCPARYLSLKEIQLHLKLHSNDFTFKCNICSYSVRQESHLQAHKTVHTTYYQEKTKEFQMKYAGSQDFPQPKVIVIPMDNGKPQLIEPNLNSDVLKWIVVPSTVSVGPPAPVEDFEEVISSTKVLNNVVNEDDTQEEKDEEEKSAIVVGVEDGKERCPHCPFSTNTVDILKNHLSHHGCTQYKFKCDHCDFAIDAEPYMKEHFKLHFSAILSANNNIKLFTNLNNRNSKTNNNSCSNNNNSNILELYAYEKNNRNNMELIYTDNNNGNNDKDGDFYIDENIEKLDKNNIILNF